MSELIKKMDKSKKVLFLTNIPVPYRVQFYEKLGKKCDLTVVFECDHEKGREKEWLKRKFENFTAISLKGISVKGHRISMELIPIIKKGNYDIIIVGIYSTFAQMLAQIYMRIKHIKYLINTDGGFVKNENLIVRTIKRFFLGNAYAYLCTGKESSEYLQYYGANAKKIFIYPFSSITNANVMTEPISIEEKRQIRDANQIIGEKIVLTVGQFIYRKGFDLLLQVARKQRDVDFYFVGGKPTKEYLLEVEEKQLKNVHFIEFLQDEKLEAYYYAADVFVLPTREDVWGLVVNEAMAYALPVITTNRCIAGLEMVNDKNGIIVESENVEQLDCAIKAIFEKDRYEMGKNAIEVAKKYTIEKSVDRHVEIFKLLCQNR